MSFGGKDVIDGGNRRNRSWARRATTRSPVRTARTRWMVRPGPMTGTAATASTRAPASRRSSAASSDARVRAGSTQALRQVVDDAKACPAWAAPPAATFATGTPTGRRTGCWNLRLSSRSTFAAAAPNGPHSTAPGPHRTSNDSADNRHVIGPCPHDQPVQPSDNGSHDGPPRTAAFRGPRAVADLAAGPRAREQQCAQRVDAAHIRLGSGRGVVQRSTGPRAFPSGWPSADVPISDGLAVR
jgi:hypothetical protein